jgi:hypothetical protein
MERIGNLALVETSAPARRRRSQTPARRREAVRSSESLAAGAEAVVRSLSELQASNQWYRAQLDQRQAEIDRLTTTLASFASETFARGLALPAPGPPAPAAAGRGLLGRLLRR